MYLILSKNHRPPPLDAPTKGRRPDTSSSGYTACKIAFKVMLIALVLCVALLPAATVKNSHAIHSALVALEPTIDTVKFNDLAQADPHPGLLRKTSKPLVHQPRDSTYVGTALLGGCAADCMYKEYGVTGMVIDCPPEEWLVLDNAIDAFALFASLCAHACNSTGIHDLVQHMMEPFRECSRRYQLTESDANNRTSEESEEQSTKQQVEQTEALVDDECDRNRSPFCGPFLDFLPPVQSSSDHQKRSEEAETKYCPSRSRIRGSCQKIIHSKSEDQEALHTRFLRRTDGVPPGAEPEEIQTCSYTAKVKNGGTCPAIPPPEFVSDPHLALISGGSMEGRQESQLPELDVSQRQAEERCKPCNGNELEFERIDDVTECPCEDSSVKPVVSFPKAGNRCPKGQKPMNRYCRKNLNNHKPFTPQSDTVLGDLAEQRTLINKYLHGTEQNDKSDSALYSKIGLRIREIWPAEWTPKTEEDCNRFRNEVSKYNECLTEVGHRNVGVKMILGFLMLAGVSSVVFFVVTCIGRAVRPKARPFTVEEMEAGGQNWYGKGGMNGDRWARGVPLPDEMRMVEDNCRGHSLVECSTSTGDGHANPNANVNANGSWAKKFIPKRASSQLAGGQKVQWESGTGTKAEMQNEAPRIPSLQLPHAELATVRKASGLAEGTIGRSWRRDGYQEKQVGVQEEDGPVNASEVTVVIAREYGMGTDTKRETDTMTGMSSGATIKNDTNAVL
ncbi:hypothetical protein CJF31_00000890 [Rutstroemia sp. NJR-2017a BVV2]|nr:hypothetical protein CJF31_00000890 [Rutstroemia sp. NJR-2017a BVV2]